jgi:hypothetical protein
MRLKTASHALKPSALSTGLLRSYGLERLTRTISLSGVVELLTWERYLAVKFAIVNLR